MLVFQMYISNLRSSYCDLHGPSFYIHSIAVSHDTGIYAYPLFNLLFVPELNKVIFQQNNEKLRVILLKNV